MDRLSIGRSKLKGRSKKSNVLEPMTTVEAGELMAIPTNLLLNNANLYQEACVFAIDEMVIG